MRSVFVDTSAFVALRNAAEAEHERARAALSELIAEGAALFTSNYVFAETYTALMVRVGRERGDRVGPPLPRRRRDRARPARARTSRNEAWEILERHGDKRWSYVDATSFALIEREGGGEAFAFDAHFAQRGLRVHPAGMSSSAREGGSRERLAPMPASRSYDRAPADIRPVDDRPRLRRQRRRLGPDLDRQNPGDLHRLGQRDRCRAGCRVAAKAGSPPSTRCCPPRPATASSATSSKGKQDGRGVEIQRLIGRSLRVVVDFKAMGERSVYVDCDVLEADGGTRCAAITGGYVALRLAFQKLIDEKALETMPLNGSVAAVSVGMVNGRALCDLDYGEDSNAEVDANVVMTGDGGLVEVQATAERTPLSRASLDELLAWPRAASRACGRCRSG